MKTLLLLLALGLTGCVTTEPQTPAAPASGTVLYRYQNTLNVGNDLIMDQVSATGYDDISLGEVNRLVVKVNDASITLRSRYTGGGAMYTPAVDLGKGGSLKVTWNEIGEEQTTVHLELQNAGVLTILGWETR